MNAWRWLGTSLLLVILGLGVSAAAQDKGKDDKDKDKDKGKSDPQAGKVELQWQAFDGTAPFYQEMTTNTSQTMTVMQQKVEQKQSQTFYIEWKPEKKDEKSWTVKQKIIGVKMDIEIGGNKISYDSTAKDQQANPLTDFFKALVDSEFTLTVDKKTMAVEKIEGREAFIAKLTKTNQQLEPLLKAILSDKALKQMADPVFAVVPEGGTLPEKKTWEKKSNLDMGPIGTYDTTYQYTLKDMKDSKAFIDVATTLNYLAPQKTAAEGLPFKIISANLKSDKGTGQVVFDTKLGRIDQSNMSLELSGDLKIEIAGSETDVNLKQKQESSLKTLDKNPLGK